MEREEKIKSLIKAINGLLDVPTQTFNKNITLSFCYSRIELSLFDDRLPLGLNKSKIYVLLPFEDDEIFAKFKEEEISVNNQIYSNLYSYSNDPTELITPQFTQAIESCRNDVSGLVNKFFEQIDKNNEYLKHFHVRNR